MTSKQKLCAIPMTIAILSKFSPPVLSLLKSCRDKGIQTVFLWIGSESESAPQSSCFTFLHCFPEDLMFKRQGIERISSVLAMYKNVSLFTINEMVAAWLVSNELDLGSDLKLMLNSKDTIEKVLSKKLQTDVAKESGLSILKTYYLTDDTKSLDLITSQDFPLCVRPSAPGSVIPSFKVDIVRDRKTLEMFMADRRFLNQGIIAQPFLNLPNLVVHGSRKINGQTIGLQGFIVERKFEGLTLTIRPIELSTILLKKCARFVEIMGITGPFHFEFLYDRENKVNWFLEINARLGGTTGKVYSLGYDEPGFLFQSYGYDVKITDRLKKKTSASKLALLKYLIHTLKNRNSPLDFPDGEPRLKRVLMTIQTLVYSRDDILSKEDIRGAASIYRAILREKLVRFKKAPDLRKS